MPDFVQQGRITTLHNFGTQSLEQLESLLRKHSASNRIGLILPVTAADMRGEPFANIINHLQDADYISRIIVSLGMAPEVQDYAEALERIAVLGERADVLWTDGKRVNKLYRSLDDLGFDVAYGSEGRSVWTALGLLLSDRSIKTVATHACDIETYDRGILARLCLPLVHDTLGFDYCKAYYARYTTRLHGRVVRLLVKPLLEALSVMFRDNDYLAYLYDFRYPLSGEFAASVDLLKSNYVPSDASIEIGTLAELYKNTSIDRMCQVDLCPQYEHRHHTLSLEDATGGLMKMSLHILMSIFRTMAGTGVVFEKGHFHTLRAAYLRAADTSIRKYHADSVMNGLDFDRQFEQEATHGFARRIIEAGEVYLSDSIGLPPIPDWNQVLSVAGDFPEKLQKAVQADAAEFKS